MTDPRWEEIRDVVHRALDLEGEARDAWLDEACGDDAELRREVDELLRNIGSETDGDFLEPPRSVRSHLPRGGHTLGEFEILRELGRGGMGVVYLARQERLERDVAVKVFVESWTTEERDVARFHREVRAAARLRHPGIVQVYSDGKIDNTHWFAMEYVEGRDLQRELQLQAARLVLDEENPFLPRPGEAEHAATIARLVADVADALHYAHGKGLVHRDVKPQNILVQRDGRVQVSDFGLVRDESLGSLTRSDELRGTPYYMSPEQAHITRVRVDHRTDIYSLGVVLYECATLTRPFEGQTSADVFSKIRDTLPRRVRSLNHRIPRDLETICHKAMAKDPRERYATAKDFADDLRRFLGHEAVVARPPTWAAHARWWLRRHRVGVAAAGLMVLGLGAGSWVTAEIAAARTRAHVSVAVRDVAGSDLEGTVGYRVVDPFTGAVGAFVRMGATPLDGAAVDPGYYRIVVDVDGEGRRTFTRQLESGDEVEIGAQVGPHQRGEEGMAWIPGGTLAVREEYAPLLVINDRDIEVEGFWLDEAEVSNAEYRRFLGATGHPAPQHWASVGPEHDDLPVVMVSWLDARSYAEWAGKRLPSLPEWTWAARGPENWIYPWPEAVAGELRGNTQRPRVPAFTSEMQPLYLANAEAVRSHPDARTASGLYHMFGNVAEWTETFRANRLEGELQAVPSDRLVVGEDWNAGTEGFTLATAVKFTGIESSFAEFGIGFRCARSAQP